MTQSSILEGVTAYVFCPYEGIIQSRETVSRKLEELGAKVVRRSTNRSISHFIYCKSVQGPCERKDDDHDDISRLFDMVAKVVTQDMLCGK